jgi:hypothetical protein
MKKEKICIDLSNDYMDCELCGADEADSCLITVGEWSFGGDAVAHCYNGYSMDAYECFVALYDYLSINVILNENDFDIQEAIKFLNDQGYKVEFTEQLFDYDEYHDIYGYDDEYDDDEKECLS